MGMEYIISAKTAGKLRKKHVVYEHEVIECFENRVKPALEDDRDEHRTRPPTKWFIAETDAERRLKVVFIQIAPSRIVIRTAYEPNDIEEKIYERKA
jgi:hypothetical protein